MTRTHPVVRYRAPNWFVRNVFNPITFGLTRLGLSMWGSRILAVRGRSSGKWRRTPVNLMEVGGERYLVAPRGVTQWVRNLRVAGEGTLSVGKRTTWFTAEEMADGDKPALLRPYLKRWAFEVGAFFDGVGADASDEELLAIAPNHPVFRIEKVDG